MFAHDKLSVTQASLKTFHLHASYRCSTDYRGAGGGGEWGWESWGEFFKRWFYHSWSLSARVTASIVFDKVTRLKSRSEFVERFCANAERRLVASCDVDDASLDLRSRVYVVR